LAASTPARRPFNLKAQRLHQGARIVNLVAGRVTHGAKKTLPMRHPISCLVRNPQKQRILGQSKKNAREHGL
jgi:hypothetical protein